MWQIKKDLDTLQQAYFTDPNDQSPWNYHDWLISLVSPIQVVALRYIEDPDGDSTKVALAIGLSHKVRNFDKLSLDIVDELGDAIEFSVVPAGSKKDRKLSSTW